MLNTTSSETVRSERVLIDRVHWIYKARSVLAKKGKLVWQTDEGQFELPGHCADMFARSLRASLEDVVALLGDSADISGIPTGIGQLDEITGGLRPQEVSVLASIPGCGKSALGLLIAYEVARSYRIPTVFVSMDTSLGMTLERLLLIATAIPRQTLRTGLLSPEQERRVSDFQSGFSDLPLEIIDASAMESTALASRLRSVVRSKGTKFVVFDNLSNFKLSRDEGAMEESAKYSIEMLADLAGWSRAHVLALANIEQDENTQLRAPSVGEIEDAEIIKPFIDTTMILHRRAIGECGLSDDAELHVFGKGQRPLGKVELHFKGDCVRFEAASNSRTGRAAEHATETFEEISVELTDNIVERLDAIAKKRGVDREKVICEMLREALVGKGERQVA